MTHKSNHLVNELMSSADIIPNGSRAWDIQIHDNRFFDRVISQRSLGLGESYMDGWWSCDSIDLFIHKLHTAMRNNQIKINLSSLKKMLIAKFINFQTKSRSLHVAHSHYNLDNELYRYMLGESMSYTCAYWKDADTLDQAQHKKHDLVCRKLNLKPGDKILELGCGWGSFAKFAATHYGCEIVSVNISEAQVNYAKEMCRDLPVSIYLCDYRDVKTYNPQGIKFDKVVSIGMCEHVGYKNYKLLMDIVSHNLKTYGLFLLHTIGGNTFTPCLEPWLAKYIFPGGVLPSIRGLGEAMEKDFVMEDWHNFGCHYDKTLMAWHQNFISHWDKIKHRYDERFSRMWIYYLLSCAGTFRSRTTQLWQIVLSNKGNPEGYESVR